MRGPWREGGGECFQRVSSTFWRVFALGQPRTLLTLKTLKHRFGLLYSGCSDTVQCVLGCVYAMVFTRPDIAYQASRLALLMSSPSDGAYEHLLGVLRYLYKTKDLGLTYGKVRDDGEDQRDKGKIYIWSDGS